MELFTNYLISKVFMKLMGSFTQILFIFISAGSVLRVKKRFAMNKLISFSLGVCPIMAISCVLLSHIKMHMPLPILIAKLKNYLSLVKFAHSIFALPFALLGFFLATIHSSDAISWKLLLLVLICMIFARNAAMSFNRWADQDIDKINPRTALREIPAKLILSQSALVFCILNACLFILTTFFINPLCFYLSPIALVVILGYSFTKRFTALSHFVLGLGLSLAPTGAYLAVTGKFDWIPVILSLAVLCWVSGFDIIYALQDDDFDRENHLRSVPVKLGRKKALNLSLLLHVCTAMLLVLAGIAGQFKMVYWIGLLIFCILLFYQHTVVKANNLDKVNLAFFTLNGIASIVFALFAITDLFMY